MARLGPGAGGLGKLHATDLYLAFACSQKSQEALAIFEKQFFPDIRTALNRRSSASAPVEETEQRVREKLFVGANPKIASFSGQGPLKAWVCAVAVREHISLHRGKDPAVPSDEQRLQEFSSGDVELDFIKQKYQRAFSLAFVAAFQELPSQERNVLRLSFLERVSIDELGVLYQIHRSTAARWVVKAREHLSANTKLLLATRFKLSDSEVDSIVRLVDKKLDVSMRELVGSK